MDSVLFDRYIDKTHTHRLNAVHYEAGCFPESASLYYPYSFY